MDINRRRCTVTDVADLDQAAAWHRQIAGLAAAADRAGVATAEVPLLRSRLFAQQARFAELAAQVGAPLPALMPSPVEIAAAASTLGDMSTPVVGRAVQTALTTLDAVDQALSGGAARPTSARTPVETTSPAQATLTAPTTGSSVTTQLAAAPPTLRNGLIYGGYAVAVMAIQIVLFFLLDEQGSLLAASPVCLIVLPAFAWLAGWLTIGMIAPSVPGQPVHRSPKLGALISAAPNFLLICALGVLIGLNLAQR